VEAVQPESCSTSLHIIAQFSKKKGFHFFLMSFERVILKQLRGCLGCLFASTLLKFKRLALELKVTLCFGGVKDWNRKSKSSPLCWQGNMLSHLEETEGGIGFP